ncbi:DUF2066 domain-containing protein [Pseudemcibacter aquimaris]|uniref:DUF2066 domain-containing protein n=1 Tax=Pseudemcibacter aquimaris TaxID=2857064 RepID=UPI002011A67F|nr:DUF2066 domain-containing protein [Pseudemcibacter aquimaris]MCC3861094.1 DUF2066 domain-containing protein [Pseudemcibacter aquimaris]WDU59912.1 DUF2066 domain-containing protein [Pseudemcibacter aquimaris]
MISIVLAVPQSVMAQFGYDDVDREATIYTIYNVEVDETARNVTTARTRALTNGQRIAFDRLLRRIILTSDKEKLDRFSDQEIQGYVSGFEINDERRSGVRYLASLVVHFNRDMVNELLSNQQIAYAETLGREVSVLPVFSESGTLRLWEKDNLWREAWQNYDVINNLVPIETPVPSLKNRLYISALQAKNNEQKSIQTYIEENTLNELIVAVATLRKFNATNEIGLDIDLMRNSPVTDDDEKGGGEIARLSVKLPKFNENGEDNMTALYDAGVDAVTAWVDDLWKMQVLVNYGISSKIAVHGVFDNMDDWLILQKQLGRVNLVQNVDLKNINIDEVSLEIEYSGEPEQLVISLAQQGVSLSQNDDNQIWEIGLTNVARSGNDD